MGNLLSIHRLPYTTMIYQILAGMDDSNIATLLIQHTGRLTTPRARLRLTLSANHDVNTEIIAINGHFETTCLISLF